MRIFANLVEKAALSGLPFLIIGGNAVIAYGYPRRTIDVDLLVREVDRRAWDALLLSLGFRQHQIARSFHMYNPTESGCPPVDLMLVNESTFKKLSEGAMEVEFEGALAHMPSLVHLIALKLHALRSGAEHRYPRDLSDVATLIQINKVDLASADYAEILERYATPTIVAEIRSLLAGSRPSSAG